jgi:LysM repeat protein
MKFQTLPIKRRPVSKGMFRRLSAVTRHRKQRVAATANASDLDADEGGSRIARALVIIFLTHIVAIGLFFIHQRYLSGRIAKHPQTATTAISATTGSTARAIIPVAARAQRTDLPRLETGEKRYVVRTGDNYTRIASLEGVDEAKLRLINEHVDIGPGLILKIPPKRIVAVEPPEVTAIREHASDRSGKNLVEAVDVSDAPKARAVRSNGTRETTGHAAASGIAASGKSYVVQPGDNVWRISTRYKVSQETLMRANGITDERKLKAGMKLVIPKG